jgi:hypothetical protein
MRNKTIGLFGPGKGPMISIMAENASIEVKGLRQGSVKATYSSGNGKEEIVLTENGDTKIGRCNWIQFEHDGEKVSPGVICSVRM